MTLYTLAADNQDNMVEINGLAVAASAGRFVIPKPDDYMELPEGSRLFSMPGRRPLAMDGEQLVKISRSSESKMALAVAAFPPPGYVRTLLPATEK